MPILFGERHGVDVLRVDDLAALVPLRLALVANAGERAVHDAGGFRARAVSVLRPAIAARTIQHDEMARIVEAHGACRMVPSVDLHLTRALAHDPRERCGEVGERSRGGAHGAVPIDQSGAVTGIERGHGGALDGRFVGAAPLQLVADEQDTVTALSHVDAPHREAHQLGTEADAGAQHGTGLVVFLQPLHARPNLTHERVPWVESLGDGVQRWCAQQAQPPAIGPDDAREFAGEDDRTAPRDDVRPHLVERHHVERGWGLVAHRLVERG